MEAIDYVKEEARKRAAQDAAKNKSRFPDLVAKGRFDLKSKLNSDKLDFSSLPWEDKEKILRILFSKMNAGVAPSNWRMQPESTNAKNHKADKGIDDIGGSPEYNLQSFSNPDQEKNF